MVLCFPTIIYFIVLKKWLMDSTYDLTRDSKVLSSHAKNPTEMLIWSSFCCENETRDL